MKDGTPTILYTKETREYARHVRYWRDVRGSQVSLFSCLSRMHHVTRVCATSGECQDQPVFVHVKRVTLQVITQYRSSFGQLGRRHAHSNSTKPVSAWTLHQVRTSTSVPFDKRGPQRDTRADK
jgi:hypothetical protein